jgi:hypothetical protein
VTAVKLFRRRKPENAEEEDDLVSNTDAAEEDSTREPTGAATGASTDPPAQAGAVPPTDDPIAQMRADAIAEVAAAENPPEGAPGSPQPDDALDAGLMDLFREAKDEVEEATLASQMPDIPIQELLGDLVTLSQRLGVKPRPRLEVNPDQEGELSLEPDEGGE